MGEHLANEKTMKSLGLFIFSVSPQHRTMTPGGQRAPAIKNVPESYKVKDKGQCVSWNILIRSIS